MRRGEIDMVIKILCSGHKDCFANTNGYCTCLMNNDFGGRDCPFYKKKAQFESGLENTDLIEMYHRRRVNAQKQ